MSEFLSRIKARLETGQHPNTSSSEEIGWVRAALAKMEKKMEDIGEEKGAGSSQDPGWQTSLVERMKVIGLGSPDGCANPMESSSSSSATRDLSFQSASQTLWETKSLESRMPNGFYSVVPTRGLKALFRSIPTLDELRQLGAEASGSDVLLIDTHTDETLASLEQLAKVMVKGLGANVALLIKKIAELVADFYGGPLFEAGPTKASTDELTTSADQACVQLLGEVKMGLCRPRALLFKFLGDSLGLHSRLLMGLQLEAVPSSSLICANPNKHLSNVVVVNGIELLVDVMRHPGYLRPFSRKVLVMYHIAGAGDSDSADYDSCDSPLEPNSPLFGFSDRLENESPEQDIDSTHLLHASRGRTSSATAGLYPPNLMIRHPMGLVGKLSPSQSEPDLANPTRRRSRRRVIDEHTAGSSPERSLEAQHDHSRPMMEGVRSFPSSPEHPQTRLRTSQRVGSEEGSISSPEHPVFKPRAPSMLSGSRRNVGEDISVSSPEQSPQHASTAGKPSPIFRRRSASLFINKQGENGRRERALSIDIKNDRKGMDFLQYIGDPAPSRVYHSPQAELRRARKRGVAPEVSDDVVRAVRAMNEAIKQERFRSKELEPYRAIPSPDALTPDSGQGSGEALGRSMESRNTDLESQPGNAKGIPSFTSFGFNNGATSGSALQNSQDLPSGSTPQETTDVQQHNQDLPVVASSSSMDTQTGAASWSLTMQSPSLPSQPLMPFSEWNIDFSELRIGVRVGIGSFGEVFRGIWRGTEVAIKVMLEQDLTVENTQDFCNEISLLSRLRHPNVILFLGACTKPPHLSMVTEYMHNGSLYRLIHSSGQGKKLSWRRRLKMLRDICRGMMSVQRMKIVHRDLKSANCLVDKHWAVKICDFGLSRIATGSTVCDSAAAGTPEWTAPELLRNEPVTDKCDVFSLGVIMWELCTLKRPWEGVKPMQVVYAVAHNRARLDIPEGLIGKLIADCWEEVPTARPGYEEILTRLHECEFLQN